MLHDTQEHQPTIEHMSTISDNVQRKGVEESDLGLVYQNAKHLSIKDLGSISYPEGFLSPKGKPYVDEETSRLRYERDFLLQFMPVCKIKPTILLPQVISARLGLDPIHSIILPFESHNMSRGGARPRASAEMPKVSTQFGINAGVTYQNQSTVPTLGHSAMKSNEEQVVLASGQRMTSAVGAAQSRPLPVASDNIKKVSKRQRTKRGVKHSPPVKSQGGTGLSEPAPLAAISSQRSLE